MNINQVNALRAQMGLAPVTPAKDSKASQKRQRDNQIARAAADKASADKRGRKGK